MTYSCTDFTDAVLDALQIVVPKESWDSPSDQADLALAEIARLHAEVEDLKRRLDDAALTLTELADQLRTAGEG